jgi:hypothetical protein
MECLDVVVLLACIAASGAYLTWLAVVCWSFYVGRIIAAGAETLINESEATRSEEHGSNEKHQCYNGFASEIKEVLSTTKCTHSKQNQERAHNSTEPDSMTGYERRSLLLQSSILGLQILIFVVGVYVACTYSGQLREMITQTELTAKRDVINRRALENAHAARLFWGAIESGPKFVPGHDWRFTTELQNLGAWPASRLTIGYNVLPVEGDGQTTLFPLPCFPRTEYSIASSRLLKNADREQDFSSR